MQSELDDMPTMEDLLLLRAGEKVYKEFYKRFVSCVITKTTYRERLRGAVSEKDFCTRSDEAFALVALENSWDRWTDEYTQNSGIPKRQRGKHGKERTASSKVQPKYTEGGIIYGDAELDKRQMKGWKNEGTCRYNAIYKMVNNDRKRNKGKFFKKWMSDKVMELAMKQTKWRRKRKVIHVLPINELFSSDEDQAGSLEEEEEENQC